MCYLLCFMIITTTLAIPVDFCDSFHRLTFACTLDICWPLRLTSACILDLEMSPPPCVVNFCKKRGTHVFPSDENRRSLWIQAIEQVKPGLTIRKNSRICSDHFKLTDFSRTPLSLLQCNAFPKTLKKTAIPSVFPWKTAPEESLSTSQDSQTFNLAKVEKTYARTPPITFVEMFSNLDTVASAANEDPLEDCQEDTNSVLHNENDEADNTVLEVDNEIAAEVEIPQNEEFQEGLLGNTETHEKSVQTQDFSIPQCEEFAFQKVLLSNSEKHEKSSQTPDNICFEKSSQTPDNVCFRIHIYKNNDKVVHFYTGLENCNKLMLVFDTLGQCAHNLNYFYGHPPQGLDAFEQFFITLLILRRHKPFQEIAMMYQVTIKQIYNIFITWIRFMSLQWKNLDLWIDKESVRAYMPLDFYDKYPSTRVILDATEFPIKKRKLPFAQQVTFSSYKNKNTVKAIIGITPSGLISYVSPCYGGSATDRQIIERSSILSRFDYNDEIMVDKGLNVQDIFAPYGVKVNMPSFFKKGSQIGPRTLNSNRNVASKRVHVERVIGLLKTYKILTQPMNQTETV